MSERGDRRHFTEYTAQNQAKHSILTAYYPAYLTALKKQAARFHFIDAFAGPGQYAGEHEGSPLLALAAMKKAGELGRSTLSCVENQADFAQALEQALQSSPLSASLKVPPLVRSGLFHEHIDEILRREIYKGSGQAATFSFVDPCGVDGVRMSDLTRLLKLPFGEVLLLFNYDGINRLFGGVDAKTHDDTILVSLFGSQERLKSVRDRLSRQPSQKELIIRDEFTAALKDDSKARYFLPFRFKAKESTRSSHYLIHCADSWLAFKLMKNVMWDVGKSESDRYGRLEFLSDDERGTHLELVRVEIEDQKKRIVNHIEARPCKVSEFTDVWMRMPTDIFSEKVYRRLLQELEAAGRILVYDKENRSPAPAAIRPTRKHVSTLGDDYWLRPAGPARS
jgi:three-Cys-motif partner protein